MSHPPPPHPLPHLKPSSTEPLPPAPITIPPPTRSKSTTSSTIPIPASLLAGVPMIKISNRKVKNSIFHLDSKGESITWQSRKTGRSEWAKQAKQSWSNGIKKLRQIPVTVRIDQIREVRYGPTACGDDRILLPPSASLNHYISIIYIQSSHSWKSLNIIPLTSEVFHTWIDTISALLGSIKVVSHQQGSVIGITGEKDEIQQPTKERMMWLDADTDRDKSVTLEEVVAMCGRIGLAAGGDGHIERSFTAADSTHKGYLDFTSFRTFVSLIKSRPEVESLYRALTSSQGAEGREGEGEERVGLGEKGFRSFLRDTQKSMLGDQEIHDLFTQFHSTKPPTPTPLLPLSLPLPPTPTTATPSPTSTEPTEPTLSLPQFQSFLLSPSNSPISAQHRGITQDMTRPLTDYYICSSHNTYLVGHQWKGDSTVEGYIRALMGGCRSVEIDCWDGDTEPVVYHGKTLTSRVSVRDVCLAISRYAFMASPYPVIISAEVHCCFEQQVALVGILKEVFGSQLVTEKMEGWGGELPSPEKLRGKVLFKCKKNLEEKEKEKGFSLMDATSALLSSSESTTESDMDKEARIKRTDSISGGILGRVTKKVNKLMNDPPSPTPYGPTLDASKQPAVLSRSSSISSTHSASGHHRKPSTTAKRPKVAQVLVDIMAYTAGVKFQGFTKLVTYAPEEMFSVSEKTANKLQKTAAADFVKHNRTHLSRVYPNGIRVTSSNYEPHEYWALGCQLVAINWQTCDLGYQLNSAMFARNGRCGYILKPAALCSSGKDLVEREVKHSLKLTIISGQHLPLLPEMTTAECRLYVEATVHVPPMPKQSSADAPPPSPSHSKGLKSRTRIITGNSFSPVWSEPATFSFKCTPGMLDLAFLRVEVKHEASLGDDPVLASWCGSLGTTEQGYRHIPLFDRLMSQYLFSTLFVRVDMSTA